MILIRKEFVSYSLGVYRLVKSMLQTKLKEENDSESAFSSFTASKVRSRDYYVYFLSMLVGCSLCSFVLGLSDSGFDGHLQYFLNSVFDS